MDSKPITQKPLLKAIGMFIAAMLVTSLLLVSVGNVAADADPVDPAAPNATGPAGPGGAPFGAAGGILSSWNNTLATGWGVGYDSDHNTVWVSDLASNDNIEFHTAGTPTGRSYSTAA
jgi:hypothetical protein